MTKRKGRKFVQAICSNGHYHEIDIERAYHYFWSQSYRQKYGEVMCFECDEPFVWKNLVSTDEKDGFKHVNPVLKEEAREERCECCGQHKYTPPTFHIPEEGNMFNSLTMRGSE